MQPRMLVASAAGGVEAVDENATDLDNMLEDGEADDSKQHQSTLCKKITDAIVVGLVVCIAIGLVVWSIGFVVLQIQLGQDTDDDDDGAGADVLWVKSCLTVPTTADAEADYLSFLVLARRCTEAATKLRQDDGRLVATDPWRERPPAGIAPMPYEKALEAVRSRRESGAAGLPLHVCLDWTSPGAAFCTIEQASE